MPFRYRPETLVHLVAFYIIRNESRRAFPKEVQLSWLTGFCISHGMQQTIVWVPQVEQTTPPVPFSEHEAHELSILFEKRFLLFPLLAENCYSLVEIERIDELLEVLKALVRFESDLPIPVVQTLCNETLRNRLKRLKGRFQSYTSTAFHDLDWNYGKHDKLRDRLHSWLVQLCFSIVRNLRNSCTEECLYVYGTRRGILQC